MGRKAMLLTSEDVPKYVREIARRLTPVKENFEDEEGSWWGYVFRLDAKWKCGYESQLRNDAEKLVKWAQSWYAHARVVKYSWWSSEVAPVQAYGGDKSHLRKALREGFRNSATIVISDPVAHRFEKDGFYKKEEGETRKCSR